MTPGLWRRRVLAKVIDAGLAAVIGGVMWARVFHHDPTAARVASGGVALLVLWVLDALEQGAWGKSVMGLRCVDAPSGRAIGAVQAMLRNLPIVLLGPGLWSLDELAAGRPLTPWCAALGALGAGWSTLEVWWMATRADGRRLGDAMGDTCVVSRPSSAS